jgi:hypothetical protein
MQIMLTRARGRLARPCARAVPTRYVATPVHHSRLRRTLRRSPAGSPLRTTPAQQTDIDEASPQALGAPIQRGSIHRGEPAQTSPAPPTSIRSRRRSQPARVGAREMAAQAREMAVHTHSHSRSRSRSPIVRRGGPLMYTRVRTYVRTRHRPSEIGTRSTSSVSRARVRACARETGSPALAGGVTDTRFSTLAIFWI